MATTGDARVIERVRKAAIRGIGRGICSPAELESWAAGLQPEFYRRAMDEQGERCFLAETARHGVAGFGADAADEVIGLYSRDRGSGTRRCGDRRSENLCCATQPSLD